MRETTLRYYDERQYHNRTGGVRRHWTAGRRCGARRGTGHIARHGVDGDDQSDAVLTDNGIVNQTDGGGIVSLLEFLFDNLNISISIDG